MPKAKIKVVDVINDIEDVPEHMENNIKVIENYVIFPVSAKVEDPPLAIEPIDTEPEPIGKTPVSNTQTVELVECPDCNKKMTKKSLKYSHAKNCPANKQPKEEKRRRRNKKTR